MFQVFTSQKQDCETNEIKILQIEIQNKKKQSGKY